MKKILLLTLIILNANAAISQKKEIKNTIKFNGISIFKQVYDVQYERVINDKSSVQIGLGFGNYSSTDNDKVRELHLENFGSTLNGNKNPFVIEKTFSLNVDYRYYYMKTTTAPKGLYLSPSLQYIKTNNSYGVVLSYSESGSNNPTPGKKVEYNQDVSIVNLRALIGCQLIIANVVCVNPYFGPSYAFGSATDYNGKDYDDAKGVLLNFGLYVGVAF